MIYRSWFQKNILCEDPLESNMLFTKLFQNIQICTSSEAVAEMVGSIMKNHVGKNRHLKPVNFSKEIVLTVNLGPQHLFIYKKDNKGNTVTRRTRLADPTHGSSIRTLREGEEKKSIFPIDFWK